MKLKVLLATLALLVTAKVSAVSLSVEAAVGGGAKPGSTKYNFDTLVPGSAAPAALPGLDVSFIPDGAAVSGASLNQYAAPFLSGNNGIGFGAPDQANGVDATPYLSSGIGSVVFEFSSWYNVFGLLWGSVDTYNTLSFYNGGTFLGSITGANVIDPASGYQGSTGTAYVNVTVVGGFFNKVVASSTNYAFEIDNVSVSVPDAASTVALLGAALVGLSLVRRRQA